MDATARRDILERIEAWLESWPDDEERPVRVIDPVGAAFANLADIGGWRRESWEFVSTSPSAIFSTSMLEGEDTA